MNFSKDCCSFHIYPLKSYSLNLCKKYAFRRLYKKYLNKDFNVEIKIKKAAQIRQPLQVVWIIYFEN